MERKSGFYWVKFGGDWETAWFDSKANDWSLVAMELNLFDDDMTEINPNRIMSPDEWDGYIGDIYDALLSGELTMPSKDGE